MFAIHHIRHCTFVWVCLLFSPSFVSAQEEVPSDVLPVPEVELPSEFAGVVEGAGTLFSIQDSPVVNFSLASSEEVEVRLQFLTSVVLLDIQATTGAAWTTLTFSGLPAETTYYRYEDAYGEPHILTTDALGGLSYNQDLSTSKRVFFQSGPSTIHIPTDTSAGTWDSVTRTYTLTGDVYESIQFDLPNVALDGAGYGVYGSSSAYGINNGGHPGTTIKNIHVQGFSTGAAVSGHDVRVLDSSFTGNSTGLSVEGNYGCVERNHVFENELTGIRLGSDTQGNWLNENIVESNGEYGIYSSTYGSRKSFNYIVGNTVTNHTSTGVRMDRTYGIVSDNTISQSSYCVYLRGSYATLASSVHRNSMTECGVGVLVYQASRTSIRANSIVDGGTGIFVYGANEQGISENTVLRNNSGIFVFGGQNRILGNDVSLNVKAGISIGGSGTVASNTVDGNGTTGIYLSGASNSVVQSNWISNNQTGLMVVNGSNDHASHNVLIGNQTGIYAAHRAIGFRAFLNDMLDNIEQARAYHSDTTAWFGNNYWNDWTAPDGNGDGAVDLPYMFTGGQDDTPRVTPNKPELYDSDDDGIANSDDNCPQVSNADQADLDGDGTGDLCDADADGDTFETSVDCDDFEAAVHPDAEESCNGIDDDCDGFIDDRDADGDGYIDNACGGDDCVDSDPTVNPGTAQPVSIRYNGPYVVGGDASLSPVSAEFLLEAAVVDASSAIVDGWPVAFKLYDATGGLVWTVVANTDPAGLSAVTVSEVGVGVYRLVAEFLADGCHYEGSSDSTVLAIYDASGGFATGGGWYWAEDEAEISELPLRGKATFGFQTRYKHGHSAGSLEFQYRAGGINLNSQGVEWLVLSASNAQFKGAARVNGIEGYVFRVMADDRNASGEADRFDIRIWDGDPDLGTTTLIHSSREVLAGGNIVVHKRH